MNRSSILATTMAMMGLSMPGASRARSVPRSRFDGQSAEAKEQALAKAAAKRKRRNEKRLKDEYRSKINNPIFVRNLANDLGWTEQPVDVGYDPAYGPDHSTTIEVTV